MKRFTLLMQVIVVSALVLPQSPAMGQQALVVKPLVEKPLTELPAGPLFWRLENFPTLEAAQAAAGPTSLAAQSRGKAWLFTLGPAGGASAGGTKVAEIGPIPGVCAFASGIRSLLCPRRRIDQPDAAWRDACGVEPGRDRTWGRHTDAGVKHRRGGPAIAGDVRGRRREAVFVSGQFSLARV